MKMRHLMLIPSVLLFSQLSICSLAQAKIIYRCEQYTNLNGKTAYRVTPSISGSFGFLTPRIHFVNVLLQLRPNNVDIKATRAVNGLGAVFPKKDKFLLSVSVK